MNPVIGVIGGMGLLATCDFMQKIIEYTDADTDQEHVRICVDCNTNIPDRTTAILHGEKARFQSSSRARNDWRQWEHRY